MIENTSKEYELKQYLLAETMKVIILYGNPIGEFYGGISTHVKYLTKYLADFKDLNLFILTFEKNNSTCKKNGVEYIELKRMKFGKVLYPFEIFYDTFRLERIIKKINPDLIHIQSTSPNFSLLAIHMLKKYPILITLHGYFREEYKIHTGWRKIIYRIFCAPLEKLALKKIPYIIALSPQIKSMVSKNTKSEVFTVPNGIDLDFIQKIKSNEKKEYPTIFFLGYLTKGKGIEDLIKVIPSVKKSQSNIKLLIGGIGPFQNQIKELVHTFDLDKDVIFLGLLGEVEKFAYMKSIDIFVLPSYWESFPMVLLEAQACGKPIITTRVGGNPYAVTNGVNGFLIQPGNQNELLEKLIYLLKEKDVCNKMGMENIKKATCFDWKIITKQTKEIYNKILNSFIEEDKH